MARSGVVHPHQTVNGKQRDLAIGFLNIKLSQRLGVESGGRFDFLLKEQLLVLFQIPGTETPGKQPGRENNCQKSEAYPGKMTPKNPGYRLNQANFRDRTYGTHSRQNIKINWVSVLSPINNIMLSKAKLKYIKSLQLKKYRKEEQSFLVEGTKSVLELLNSDFEISMVAATQEFIDRHQKQLTRRNVETILASEGELGSAGSLLTNSGALAVARMKPNLKPSHGANDFVLALDDIRDPGNVGTIIRTADWYGIKTVVASEETADFYNSKTINATMGSFCRISVYYTDLSAYLETASKVYGAFLDGEDVHRVAFGRGGVVVVGNESNGISTAVAARIHQKITIPKFGGAESLNAGVATAIILDSIRQSQK
jgi:RNA methyltransferase, TrmH family